MEQVTFPITNWAEDDKPREKLMLKGKAALSDAELIAILIGSGSRSESAVDLSKRILATVDSNLNTLGKLSLAQLTDFKGIGEAKAISIIAAMELGRRRRSEVALELKKITSSKSIFELMQPEIGELPHEEFWILILNRANQVVKEEYLSKGGISGTVVDVRLICKAAIENNASALVIAHNHPSGQLTASEQDKSITKKLKEALKTFEIALLDHLIIGDQQYYSFADDGIL